MKTYQEYRDSYKSETYEFEKGELGEGDKWYITTNELIEDDTGRIVCKHCHNREEIIVGRGMNGEIMTDVFWICPTVITAMNESEYNNTTLCFNCLMEALDQIGFVTREYS